MMSSEPQIKTASLQWHSPMLDDISGVKTWDKVNLGMMKMYKAEVLAKLPVAQHFIFTNLKEVHSKNEDSLVADHSGHLHIKGQHRWGECCRIPVPSSFAAANSGNKNLAIRRILFD
ncbi:hypothetical protein KEM48_003282 [Puccinia striiformis f. sp. tritici PST-130]|nr:hypothetical protein KEM48_003282 [Puccinia striiformis f. sp. tritici PST-130]